jgi:hypothetical protein
MKSLRVYLMGWVTGLVVGVVLVERWRRTGHLLPTPDSVDEVAETAPASPPPAPAASQQKLSTAVVAGAKADVLHVRRLIVRTIPPAVRRSPTKGAGPTV